MAFESWFEEFNIDIPVPAALSVLKLNDDGATVPFIARYRKEKTGNLDEVQIQRILDAKEKWDSVRKRQEFITTEIESQGKLTVVLKAQISSTFDLNLLEDIYLPFKQRKKTKAALAKAAGLEPLADWIWNCAKGTETPQPGQTLLIWAYTFRNEEKGISNPETAIQGACDILVERLSDNQTLRAHVRKMLFEKGFLQSEKSEKSKENSKFDKYFNSQESVASLLRPENTHRYLAIRRGWIEEELKIKVVGEKENPDFEKELFFPFEQISSCQNDSPGKEVLLKAAQTALKAYIYPSIENEVHKSLREVADQIAVRVFSENLKKILLAPPFGAKAVMGIDPGIRSGCKIALVDASGKFLCHSIIQLQSEEDKTKAKDILLELLKNNAVDAIAIGNGTFGRETEIFIRQCLSEATLSQPVIMVSESGASVYSASEVAREEFPELDITIRGAISIARRLQDPLAELVKTDPKSIGVGQYQHDVNPNFLKKALETIVDNCVHSVGVNLNTASPYLLGRVSGIGPQTAKALVAIRNEKGLFQSRDELQSIPGISKKTFELASGFLRIPNSVNILDNTGVHPENYPIIYKWAEKFSKVVTDLLGTGTETLKSHPELAGEIGEFTFRDIIEELEKPGRDSRNPFIAFSFKNDIFKIQDLKVGMEYPGIVTNVTNFGAFVDVGVHQDGLVHISQLTDKFIKDPRDFINTGDTVKVRVLEVNLDKKQIAFSMKPPKVFQPPKPKPRPQQQRPQPPVAPRRNQQPKPPPRPPKPKFANNPFAVLASLKDKK